MNKSKLLKQGYITIEYVILASIIGVFTIIAFVYIWPKSSRRPIDVSNNELVAVIGGNNNDKVGSGGGTVILPPSNNEIDFEIANVSGGVSITKYVGTETNVIIPSQIGGKDVVEIGIRAFANKMIESVSLPSTVKKIGVRAFDTNKLTDIDLTNVEEIGEYSFTNNRLKSVKTSRLTNIPIGAFMQNQLLTITINNKVSTIGAQAFSNNHLQTIDIPEGVVQIGTKAFYNNEISTVYISSSVSSMGENAFNFQEGFASGVVFIDGVFNRFDRTWSNIFDDKLHKEVKNEFKCTKLSETTCALNQYNGSSLDVIIPTEIEGMTVVEIKDNVFLNRGIVSVTMPDTIQKIGESSFEGNELTQLNLPSSVKNIGKNSFANNALKVITISDNIISIGKNSFANQNIISGMVIMSDNTYSKFSSSWNSLFDSKLQRN